MSAVSSLKETRVTVTKEVARLYVVGRVHEGLKPGVTLTVPKWAADLIIKAGIAEYRGSSLDIASLAQVEWRERRSSSELVEVQPDFYKELKELLSSLRDNDSSKYNEALARAVSIISMRITKLFTFASKGIQPDKIRNIAPEEIKLYIRVRRELERWLTEIGLSEVRV